MSIENKNEQITVGDLKLWMVDDSGSRCWYAAKSEEAVLNTYKAIIGDAYREDRTEILPETTDGRVLCDNDDGPVTERKMSDLMAEIENPGPDAAYFIASDDC